MTDDLFADGEARILDRGYRHYDGVRLPRQPYVTVLLHGIQRGLGLRRRASTMILPFLAIAIAYVPAVVIVGMAAMFRSSTGIDPPTPTYGDYLMSISPSIILMTALMAPEVFGNDQRTGMLGIYLASPLTRNGYLLAKSASVVSVLCLVTAGPQLLLLVAATVQGTGPSGPGAWVVVLLRIVASGLVVSVLLGAMSIAVTVATNNKGIAIAVIAVLLPMLGAIAAGLAGAAGISLLRSLSLLEVVFNLPPLVHGEVTHGPDGMSASVVWLGFAIWVFGGSLLAWYRVQRIEVTR